MYSFYLVLSYGKGYHGFTELENPCEWHNDLLISESVWMVPGTIGVDD